MLFWSDIYILQIIIKQELEQLTKILQGNLILKFPIKIRDIHKTEKKKNCIDISVVGCKSKKKYQIYVSKNTSKRYVDLLLIGEESNRHYVRIKDLIPLCMFIDYIVEENILVIIQEKY